MTSEFFGPLPPSDFNQDAMVRWLDQQVVSFQKIITGSLQADNVLSSSNYVAGVSGWMIDGDGNAEFNDITVRGDIVSTNWDGTIPIDLSSYDVGATAGFALDSSEGTAQFMGDMFVGGDLRLRGSTARFGTGPTGGPRIDMVAGQSADGADNALFTMFYLTNIADPTINSHPSIAAFVSGRGTPGETNTLNLRSGAYGSDGRGHITITSRSLDGSSNPTALVRIGGPGGPTRFAASDAAFFDDRTFFSDGSASQPAIAFQSDTDTGIYLEGNNFLGFAASGARRFAMGSVALQGDGSTGGVQIRSAPGSASTPDYSFVGDTDTGMFRPGVDGLGFAAGGSEVGRANPNGLNTISGTTGSAANVFLQDAGLRPFLRSTSARKYKSRISYNPKLADIDLRPAKFYRKDDKAWYYGFIADDLAEQDPLLGVYEDGEVENYDQRAVLAVLAAKVNRLESLLAA